MSIPTTNIYCIKCGYEKNFIALPIDYCYVMPNKNKVKAVVLWGWCLECKGLSLIQVALIPEELQIQLLKSQMYLDKNKPKANESINKMYLRDIAETKVKNIPKYLELIGNKKTNACCTDCGAIFTEDLYLKTKVIKKEPYVEQVLFTHPNCGGELRLKEGNMRIAFTDERKENILKIELL